MLFTRFLLHRCQFEFEFVLPHLLLLLQHKYKPRVVVAVVLFLSGICAICNILICICELANTLRRTPTYTRRAFKKHLRLRFTLFSCSNFYPCFFPVFFQCFLCFYVFALLFFFLPLCLSCRPQTLFYWNLLYLILFTAATFVICDLVRRPWDVKFIGHFALFNNQCGIINN